MRRYPEEVIEAIGVQSYLLPWAEDLEAVVRKRGISLQEQLQPPSLRRNAVSAPQDRRDWILYGSDEIVKRQKSAVRVIGRK